MAKNGTYTLKAGDHIESFTLTERGLTFKMKKNGDWDRIRANHLDDSAGPPEIKDEMRWETNGMNATLRPRKGNWTDEQLNRVFESLAYAPDILPYDDCVAVAKTFAVNPPLVERKEQKLEELRSLALGMYEHQLDAMLDGIRHYATLDPEVRDISPSWFDAAHRVKCINENPYGTDSDRAEAEKYRKAARGEEPASKVEQVVTARKEEAAAATAEIGRLVPRR